MNEENFTRALKEKFLSMQDLKPEMQNSGKSLVFKGFEFGHMTKNENRPPDEVMRVLYYIVNFFRTLLL